MRTVSGRVMRGSADSPQTVPGQTVVLHRISADSSGPVDSVRTSADGAFRFRYRFAGPRSMYIVSARYSGVAYFTTPLQAASVASPDADISVYDTTSVSFPLSVRARHVVVGLADQAGVRRVVDVFEVANDSNRTLVAGRTGTWRMTLPAGAREAASGGGDLPPEAFRFNGESAELMVPFPPGTRQVVLTYAIPARGKVSVPVTDAVGRLEVLIEGEGVRATGAGLATEEPVSMEGRSFQRYIAAPVTAAAAFEVSRAGMTGSMTRWVLLLVAATAVTLGIFVLGPRAAARAAVAPSSPRTATDALAREIAALDHVYATPARQAGSGGEQYRARRAALMARLTDALAVEDRDRAT